jgi:hypothetical protein
MALVKIDDFRLLAGSEALVDYRHTPAHMTEPFLHLLFCGRCGVRAFSKGGLLPALGAAFYAVNLACLDDASVEELVNAPVRYFNGQGDDWVKPLEGETRHL